jgi:Helix-turn-helix domain
MAQGRPKAELHLSAQERAQMQGIANARALPHGLVRRVQSVLASADGEANSAIAKRMGLTNATVGKWRQRYLENGIEGLHDELRAGRPRSFEDERVADVINRTLQTCACGPAARPHYPVGMVITGSCGWPVFSTAFRISMRPLNTRLEA